MSWLQQSLEAGHKESSAKQVVHNFNPTLEKQRKIDLFKFYASVFYITNCMTDRDT